MPYLHRVLHLGHISTHTPVYGDKYKGQKRYYEGWEETRQDPRQCAGAQHRKGLRRKRATEFVLLLTGVCLSLPRASAAPWVWHFLLHSWSMWGSGEVPRGGMSELCLGLWSGEHGSGTFSPAWCIPGGQAWTAVWLHVSAITPISHHHKTTSRYYFLPLIGKETGSRG